MPWICPYCNRIYLGLGALIKHLKHVHSLDLPSPCGRAHNARRHGRSTKIVHWLERHGVKLVYLEPASEVVA